MIDPVYCKIHAVFDGHYCQSRSHQGLIVQGHRPQDQVQYLVALSQGLTSLCFKGVVVHTGDFCYFRY